jgi:hypothetical protein
MSIYLPRASAGVAAALQTSQAYSFFAGLRFIFA